MRDPIRNVVALLLMLWAGPVWAQPRNVPVGPPSKGPAPYLTTVVEMRAEDLWKAAEGGAVRRDERLLLPTRETIKHAWHDTPFAVVIPVENPFEGGRVCLSAAVRLEWDGPEAARADLKAAQYEPYATGICRLDDEPWGATTVSTVMWGQKSMELYTDGPYPVWSDALRPTPAVLALVDFPTAIDRKAPRARSFDLQSAYPRGNMYLLNESRPGWYGVWFTPKLKIDRWPDPPLRTEDEIQLRMRVCYMISRAIPSQAALDYLFDGVKPAAGPLAELADTNSYRAFTVELPIVVRRNVWLFDGVEIRPQNAWSNWLARGGDAPGRDPSGTQIERIVTNRNATALDLEAHLANFHHPYGRPSEPVVMDRRETLHWRFDFPAAIAPRQQAAVRVSCRRMEQMLRALPPDQISRLRNFFFAWVSRGDVEVDGPTGLRFQGEPRGATSPGGAARFSWGMEETPPQDASYVFDFNSHIDYEPGSYLTPTARQSMERGFGTRRLVSLDAGPWRVDGLYIRRSERERRGTGIAGRTDRVEAAVEKDPFWEWYPAFSRLLDTQLVAVSQCRLLGAAHGMELAEMLVRQRDVVAQLGAPRGPSAPGSGITRDARQLVERVAALVTDTDGFRMLEQSLATGPDNATLHRLLVQHARLLAAKIGEKRSALSALNAQGLAAYGVILAELKKAEDRFGERHPEIGTWSRHFRFQAQMFPYEMAAGSGDPYMLQLAIDAVPEEELFTAARVLQARMLLDQRRAIDALFVTRRAAAADPGHPEARRLLEQIEAACLHAAVEKSQGAIRNARDAFSRYLNERGFRDLDRVSTNDVWFVALAHPTISSGRELIWASFTTGISGILSGLWDRPESEAALVDAVQREMTTAYVGLQLMIRLRLRGHTFDEIRAMTTSDLAAALPLRRLNDRPYTKEELRRFGVAIHEALQLPEVAALARGDLDSTAFELAMRNAKWDAAPIMDTWIEWFGDITSLKNLMSLLLPYSKATIGSRGAGAGYWSAAEAQRVGNLAAAGRVASGADALAGALHMQRAFQALGSTRAGAALVQMLERKKKWEKSLGWVSGTTLTAGKLLGGFVIQSAATSLAEERFGPETAFLLDAMLQFVGDSDSLTRLLQGNGIEPEIVRRIVRNHHVPRLRKAAQQVIVVEQVARDLPAIVAASRQGKPLSSAQQSRRREAQLVVEQGPMPALLPEPAPKTTLPSPADQPPVVPVPPWEKPTVETPPWQRVTVRDPRMDRTIVAPPERRPTVRSPGSDGPTVMNPTILNPLVPNGNPAHDSILSIRQALADAEKGVDSGAAGSAAEFASSLRQQGEALNQRAGNLEALARPHGPLPPIADGADSISIPHRLIVDANLVRHGPVIRPDSALGRAESALARGDPDSAFEYYREAVALYAERADRNLPLSDGEISARMLDLKMGLARALKAGQLNPARIAPTPPGSLRNALKPIPPERVRAIAASHNRIRAISEGSGGSTDLVEEGGERFVRKFWSPGPADEQLVDSSLARNSARIKRADDILMDHKLLMFEGELFGARLMRMAGFAAPDTHCVVNFNSRGEVTGGFVVTREIPGARLSDLSPAEVYALRFQNAELRACSLVLGDHDRHPANYIVASGVQTAFDFGMCSPRSLGGIWKNEDGMKMAADIYYARSFQSAASEVKLDPFTRAEVIHESALTYQAAKPGLDRMRKLIEKQPEKVRREIEQVYRDLLSQIPELKNDPQRLNRLVADYGADAWDALRERLKMAEPVIRNFNRRNGIPLDAPLPLPEPPQIIRFQPPAPAIDRWRLAA